MTRFVYLTLIACSLSLTNGANAALIFGAGGQNLMQDTTTSLLWLPPTASADEVDELSQFGNNVRIATAAEVAALFSTHFDFTIGIQPVDPALLAFLEFAVSGSNDPVPSTCGRLDFQECVGFFAWSLGEGFTEQQPLSSYNFTGNFFGYDTAFGVGADWDFAAAQTLGSYPIDPCDTFFFEVCSTNAFRIMEPVPLPGAVWLLISGLISLGVWNRQSTRWPDSVKI